MTLKFGDAQGPEVQKVHHGGHARGKREGHEIESSLRAECPGHGLYGFSELY
jgi:hypothetical protein